MDILTNYWDRFKIVNNRNYNLCVYIAIVYYYIPGIYWNELINMDEYTEVLDITQYKMNVPVIKS